MCLSRAAGPTRCFTQQKEIRGEIKSGSMVLGRDEKDTDLQRFFSLVLSLPLSPSHTHTQNQKSSYTKTFILFFFFSLASACMGFCKIFITLGTPRACLQGGYGYCASLKERAAPSTFQLNPQHKWWIGITGETCTKIDDS